MTEAEAEEYAYHGIEQARDDYEAGYRDGVRAVEHRATQLFRSYALQIHQGRAGRGEIPAAQAPMIADEVARQFRVTLQNSK